MKNILLILIGALILMGCQKDKNKYPYSTWTVTKGNQVETFKTNNVRIDGVTRHPVAPDSRNIASLDRINWFHLRFMKNYFPIRDDFPLWDFINNPGEDNRMHAFLVFYYQSYSIEKKGYSPIGSDSSMLYTSTDKKNIIYTLPKTRFINGGDLSDTIYVEGVFKVPKEY